MGVCCSRNNKKMINNSNAKMDDLKVEYTSVPTAPIATAIVPPVYNPTADYDFLVDSEEENKHDYKEKLAIFTWKLPSKSIEHIRLLCYGYIRMESHRFMPDEMIHICFNYMNDYDYIINNIDTHKKYVSNYNQCDVSNCIFFSR
eukprot:479288_1